LTLLFHSAFLLLVEWSARAGAQVNLPESQPSLVGFRIKVVSISFPVKILESIGGDCVNRISRGLLDHHGVSIAATKDDVLLHEAIYDRFNFRGKIVGVGGDWQDRKSGNGRKNNTPKACIYL
jgi:hypothetical protein